MSSILSLRSLNALALIAFVAVPSVALADTTWTGATSTNWETGSNWTAGTPDAAENVTIPRAASLANRPTLTASEASTINLIMEQGAQLDTASFVLPISGLTIAAAGTGTAQILATGSGAGDGVRPNVNNCTFDLTNGSINIERIESDLPNVGDTVRVSGNNTLAVTGFWRQVDGAWDFGFSGTPTVTIADLSGDNLPAGSITVTAGSVTFNNNAIINANGAPITVSGGTLTLNRRLRLSSNASVLTVSGGTCVVEGATDTGLALHVDVDGAPSNMVVSSGTLDINGNFDLGTGGGIQGNVSHTGGTIQISGDWVHSSNDDDYVASGAALVLFDGTGAQSINSANATLANARFRNLSINSGNTVTITAFAATPFQVQSLNILEGTLACNGETLDVDGLLTIGNGTGTSAVLSGFAASPTVGGGLTQGSEGDFVPNGTLTFDGAGTWQSANAAETFGAVSIAPGAATTVTAGSNLTMTTLALTSGIFAGGAGNVTVTNSGAAVVTVAAGTFTGDTGTFTYSAAVATTVATTGLTYNVLSITGAATKTLAGTATASAVNVGPGATLALAATTLTLASATPTTGSGTITNGTVELTSGAGAAIGGLTYPSLTINGTGNFDLSANTTVTTVCTVTSGTLRLVTFTLNLTNPANSTPLASAAGNFNAGTGTVNYAPSAGTPTITLAAVAYSTLTVNRTGAAFNLSGATTAASLNVTTGTLNTSGQTLGVTGATVVAGTLAADATVTLGGSLNATGGSITQSAGSFVFNAAGAQAVTLDGGETFFALTVNGVATDLDVTGNLVVTNLCEITTDNSHIDFQAAGNTASVGALTVSGGTGAQFNMAAAAGLNSLTCGGAITITSGSVTVTQTGVCSATSLTVSGADTAAFTHSGTGATTVSGDVTVTQGVVTFGNSAANAITGNVTFGAGGAVRSLQLAGTVALGGNLTGTNATAFTAPATLNFNGAGASTVLMTGVVTSFNAVTVNKGAAATLVTIDRTAAETFTAAAVTVGTGTLDLNCASSFSGATQVNATGTLRNDNTNGTTHVFQAGVTIAAGTDRFAFTATSLTLTFTTGTNVSVGAGGGTSNFRVVGAAGLLNTVQSSTATNFTVTAAAATDVVADFVALSDCTGAGAGIPFTANNSFDVSGDNTNWTFPAKTTQFTGTGNWSVPANWSLGPPNSGDTVTFAAAAGNSVCNLAGRTLAVLDMSGGYANTLTINNALVVTGLTTATRITLGGVALTCNGGITVANSFDTSAAGSSLTATDLSLGAGATFAEGAANTTLRGNLTVDATATWTNNATGVLLFDPTVANGTQSWTGSGTAGVGNVQLDNVSGTSTVVTLGGNVTVTTIDITTGDTLDLGGFSLSSTTALSVNLSGTLRDPTAAGAGTALDVEDLVINATGIYTEGVHDTRVSGGLTVNAAGTWTNNATGALIFEADGATPTWTGSGAAVSGVGNVVITDGATNVRTLTLASNATVTTLAVQNDDRLSSGAFNLTVNGVTGNATPLSFAASTSYVQVANAGIVLASVEPNTVVPSVVNFRNLSLSPGAATTYRPQAGTNLTCFGTLTVGANATYQLFDGAANSGLQVASSTTINGSISAAGTVAGTITLQFAQLDVDGSLDLAPGAATVDVTISSSIEAAVPGGATITHDSGTFTFSGAGTQPVALGGGNDTFAAMTVTGGPTLVNVTGNLVVTGLCQITGAGAHIDMQANGNTVTVGALTLNAAGAQLNTAAGGANTVSVTGAITITNGQVSIQGTGTCNAGSLSLANAASSFTKTGTGATTITGAVSINPGSVSLNSAANAIGSLALSNGSLTLNGGSLVVSGNWSTVGATTTFTHNSTPVTFNTAADVAITPGDDAFAAVTVTKGANTATFTGPVTFGGLLTANTGNTTINGNATLSAGLTVAAGAYSATGVTAVTGNLTVSGGGSATLGNATNTVSGNVTVSNGSLVGDAGGGRLEFQGTWSTADAPGPTTLTQNGMLVVATGAANPQTITQAGDAFTNFTVDKTGTANVSGLNVTGTLTVLSGTVQPSGAVTALANVTCNGGTFNNNAFGFTTGTVTITTGTFQVTTGTVVFSNAMGAGTGTLTMTAAGRIDLNGGIGTFTGTITHNNGELHFPTPTNNLSGLAGYTGGAAALVVLEAPAGMALTLGTTVLRNVRIDVSAVTVTGAFAATTGTVTLNAALNLGTTGSMGALAIDTAGDTLTLGTGTCTVGNVSIFAAGSIVLNGSTLNVTTNFTMTSGTINDSNNVNSVLDVDVAFAPTGLAGTLDMSHGRFQCAGATVNFAGLGTVGFATSGVLRLDLAGAGTQTVTLKNTTDLRSLEVNRGAVGQTVAFAAVAPTLAGTTTINTGTLDLTQSTTFAAS